jgi:hypothetical protein
METQSHEDRRKREQTGYDWHEEWLDEGEETRVLLDTALHRASAAGSHCV